MGILFQSEALSKVGSNILDQGQRDCKTSRIPVPQSHWSKPTSPSSVCGQVATKPQMKD